MQVSFSSFFAVSTVSQILLCFLSWRRKHYSMCELRLLFGHTLSHLKFEIHVVMRLSQRRLQTCCQNINSSSSNALALKGEKLKINGTLIGLLHASPKTHLRVSDQPILDLCRAQKSFIIRHNSNIAITHNTAHKATRAWRFTLAFQTVKIGPIDLKKQTKTTQQNVLCCKNLTNSFIT